MAVPNVKQVSKLDNFPYGRTIDVLLLDDVNLLDVAGPVQAFETANNGVRRRYQTRFVSLDGASARASCGVKLVPDARLSSGQQGDDLLIPGGVGVDALLGHSPLREIMRKRAALSGGGRLIAVCSGALILADAESLMNVSQRRIGPAQTTCGRFQRSDGT